MTQAVVFPGQGSQSVGMLDDFPQAIVRATLDEASDALGWDVAALIQDGPVEQLDSTRYTQPAILAASVALWRLACDGGQLEPAVMAGHSLGEYSALVAAGSLTLGDAARLVEARGRAMQEYAPEGAGMVAVLGLDDEAVRALCEQRAEGGLYPVNFNAPGQVVVAGRSEALDWLEANGKDAGARKLQRLAMSVPSHCPLLAGAADAFAPMLDGITIEAPTIPVLHNVDALPRSDADAVRDALRRQLCEAVRWTQTQGAMLDRGVSAVIECGPGKVLTGLAKRGMPGVPALSLGSAAGMDNLLAQVSSTS
ncbi:ACP S-malonyltransferase [Algiphilus sp.]|uniref:ACP S-malonyltransferase n=1 Tax=Algiphilus sp. TaxID=1872431 RepID=UPI003C65A41A